MSSNRPLSSSSPRKGVPVHSAVLIASSIHGWLMGRGLRSARPLPAHSIVTGSVTAGLRLMSSRVSIIGFDTRPLICNCHDRASTYGISKWMRR